jgi:hypothetical protein
MQDSERRNYEMLARVRDFHGPRAASFPAATRGGELFVSLDAVLREIEANAEAKESHTSTAAQGTANRRAARGAM